jgi:hypothetical protein
MPAHTFFESLLALTIEGFCSVAPILAPVCIAFGTNASGELPLH